MNEPLLKPEAYRFIGRVLMGGAIGAAFGWPGLVFLIGFMIWDHGHGN